MIERRRIDDGGLEPALVRLTSGLSQQVVN